MKKLFYYICRPYPPKYKVYSDKLPDGVTGNTSVFGTEESRFEPWSGNKTKI